MGKKRMIPTEEQAKKLWGKYGLPQGKQRHVGFVANVAKLLATKLKAQISKLKINTKLLVAGSLLHDIDKNVPKLPGEQHPDTGVRILREEGMEEVARLVETHPLHAILDSAIAPKTWEEKLLFLADKMVKDEVIGVDERFRLWNEEHLPPEEQTVLDGAYPKVKDMEREVLTLIGRSEKRILEELKRRRSMKRFFVLALLLLGMLVPASSFAGEMKPEYALPYPGILPDHPLYFLKQVRDGILDRLIVDPLRKAEFLVLQADKRLAMGKMLVEKVKGPLAETTISKGEKYMERAVSGLTAFKSTGRPVPASLIDLLTRSTEKHVEVLTELGLTGSLEFVRKLQSEVEKLK